METAGGLFLLGNYLNSKDSSKPTNNINKHDVSKLSSKQTSDNIYNSNQYKKSNEYVNKKAKQRFNNSMNTTKTGIVPDKYNQVLAQKKNNNTIETFDNDSIFSDNNSQCSNNNSNISIDVNDPMAIFNHSNFMSDNTAHEKKYKNKNEFLTQFDDLQYDNVGGPASFNSTSETLGANGQQKKDQMERQLALDGEYSKFEKDDSMTYNVVDGDDFSHINMTPYFSGNAVGYGTSNEEQDRIDNTNQRKVDLFTGSLNSLDYRPRTERRPLFNPIMGLTNIYGAPSATEYMESRYIPSKERRNEFPIPQVKVTPGVNLGYNEVSNQGFHDTWRPMPKDIDDLRPANKPHVSYEGVVIPGKKGTKRASLPTVEKHRPDTYVENDPKNMMKSSGYIKAPKVRDNFDMPETNRNQTTRGYVGPVARSTDAIRPDSMIPKVKVSHKVSYKESEPRNIGASQTSKIKAVNYNDTPEVTKKDMTAKTNRVGNMGNHETSKPQYVDYNDIPDPTLKDTLAHQNRTGNMSGNQFAKQQGFNYNDIPDATLKDIHALQNRTGNMNGNQFAKQQGFNYNDMPDATLKDMYAHQNRTGNMTGNEFTRQQGFNYNDIPDATLKDMHAHQNRTGNMNGQQFNKQPGFNYNDLPDPTLKEMFVDTNRAGNMNGQQFNKQPGFNYNDIPDSTLKEMYIDTNRAGNMNGQQFNKQPGFNYNDVPDSTLKEMYIDTNRAGNMNGQQFNKQPGFNYNDVPDPTLKQMYIDTNRAGNMNGQQFNKQPGFNYNDVPDPTLKQMYIDTNRAGNMGSQQMNKGAYDVTHQNTEAKQTLRQLTSNNNYVQPIGNSQMEQGGYKVVHQTTKAKPTMRQLTENNTHINQMGGSSIEKGAYTIAHQTTTAKPTLRQLTQNNTHINQMGGSSIEKGAYTVAHQTTIAKPTLRQLTQHTKHINPSGSHEHQPSRADAASSQVNDTKEQIIKGRTPTTCNFEQGPIINSDNIRYDKEPLIYNRAMVPSAGWTNTNEHLPILHTQMNVPLQNWNQRYMNTYVADNLKNNPYVNNLVHKNRNEQ